MLLSGERTRENLVDQFICLCEATVWARLLSNLAESDQITNIEMARYLSALSPQELKIRILLTEGRLNQHIAYEVHVTEATVKAHTKATRTSGA